MSRKMVDGFWVVVCDWTDPLTEELCTLGEDGDKAMYIDPMGGKGRDTHFQCGRHHGVVPQSEKPEFQLPKGHKLNEEVLTPGRNNSQTKIEEVDDD